MNDFEMRLIDVSTKKFPGAMAMVDARDHERLSQHKWTATQPQNVIYATRPILKNGKKTTVRMHCEILGVVGIDHKDGDGLNNCRSNLRPCTNTQNQHNRKRVHGSSKFKGVSWHKGERKWRANIVVDKKQISLGYFADEVTAAHAYDAAAEIHFGEFASPNFGLMHG